MYPQQHKKNHYPKTTNAVTEADWRQIARYIRTQKSSPSANTILVTLSMAMIAQSPVCLITHTHSLSYINTIHRTKNIHQFWLCEQKRVITLPCQNIELGDRIDVPVGCLCCSSQRPNRALQ